MALPPFSVTWDYRCPFARNAHEHLIAGLEAGEPWEVTFLPFSLSQAHVPEGGTSVWDDPSKAKDLMAMAAGVVVRDRHPEHFLAVHLALFAARHDEGLDLRESDVVLDVLQRAGAPADVVMAELEDGWAQKEMQSAHERAVSDHAVFGVPTFIVEDRAVFVRLMTRPEGDASLAKDTVEQTVALIAGRPELNEFKYTSIPR
jgi:protein-disulfide isomerase-like protein with CxxC motif